MKKLFSAILALTLTLALTSCGKSATEIPEEILGGLEYYQDCLKDPKSLRIYGDVIVWTLDGDPCISVECDAKNSYGAYNGAETVEIFCRDGDYFHVSGNEIIGFADLWYKAQNGTANQRQTEEVEKSYAAYSGSDVAELLGCEYMD